MSSEIQATASMVTDRMKDDLNLGPPTTSTGSLIRAVRHLFGDQLWRRRAPVGGARLLKGPERAIPELPSAALPGIANLVTFRPRVASPFAALPIDAVDIPTTVAAENGYALHALVPAVCHGGEPHPQLQPRKTDRPFTAAEPAAPLPSPAAPADRRDGPRRESVRCGAT